MKIVETDTGTRWLLSGLSLDKAQTLTIWREVLRSCASHDSYTQRQRKGTNIFKTIRTYRARLAQHPKFASGI